MGWRCRCDERPPDRTDRHAAAVPRTHDDHRCYRATAGVGNRQDLAPSGRGSLAGKQPMNPGRRLFVSAATMILTVPIALAAWAAPTPTEQVRSAVQRVLRILDDPELRGEMRQAERRVAIRKVAHELFDFAEITKRSIGHHWQQRTAVEREELVSLFGDLLERTYVSRIEVYSGETNADVGERGGNDRALVP